MGHRSLPTYLSGDPEGILQFDAAAFIREAGMVDSVERRRDVGEIALRVVRDSYPRARMVMVLLGGKLDLPEGGGR
jgi:hypothetical protein